MLRQDLEQDRSERVDIDRAADLAAGSELLGRDVAGRAKELARLGITIEAVDVAGRGLDHGVGGYAREAPVDDVDLAVVAEHDVRWLEVAVHDTAHVRELDGQADLAERAQRALARRLLVRKLVAQRHSGEALHREVRAPVRIVAELVDRHDRGMIEAGLDPRLAKEPLDVGVARRGGVEPLERDVPPDPAVVSADDLSHPCLADHLPDRVRGEGVQGGVVDLVPWIHALIVCGPGAGLPGL